MTYRERREAKAERLRGWAEGREAKAAAAHAADEAIGRMIPLGQPILVGHHSQRRAERDRDRMIAHATAAHDHSRTAERMRERATSIERQAAGAIYSDDPDAIERLEEKIAKLEAQREHVKAANAAYRREHKAELKAMSAYARSQAVPYPAYVAQNLTGNIGRLRKRLEELKHPRPVADRIIPARYAGECADCGAPIERGQTIRYSRADGARCEKCPEEVDAA